MANPVEAADPLPAQSHGENPTQAPQCQPNVGQTGYAPYLNARDSAMPQSSRSFTVLPPQAPQYLQLPSPGTFPQNDTHQLPHHHNQAPPARSEPVPSITVSQPITRSLKEQTFQLDQNIKITLQQIHKLREYQKQCEIYNVTIVTSQDRNLHKHLETLFTQKAELEVRMDEEEKENRLRELLNLRKEMFELKRELETLRERVDPREAKRRRISTT